MSFKNRVRAPGQRDVQTFAKIVESKHRDLAKLASLDVSYDENARRSLQRLTVTKLTVRRATMMSTK